MSSEASGYRLSVGGFDSSSSTAGESFSQAAEGMEQYGKAFSTRDSDNDHSPTNCAADVKGYVRLPNIQYYNMYESGAILFQIQR